MSLKKILLLSALLIIISVLIGCPAVVDPESMDSEISSVLMNLSSDSSIHRLSVRGEDNLQFVFDHDADIETYANDEGSEQGSGKIHLVLPPGSSVDSITPYIELDKNGSVSPSGILNLANVQSFFVKAEDSSERNYDFTYEVQDGTTLGREITGFMFKKAANPGNLYYDIYPDLLDSTTDPGIITVNIPNNAVPPSTVITDFVPSFEISGYEFTVGGTPKSSGTDTINFNPTATVDVNGNGTKQYNITVNVLQNSAKNITSFKFLDAANPGISSDYTGSIAGNDITVNVPSGDITNLTASVICSAESAYIPTGGVDYTGSDTTPVVFTVTAEDGTSQNYNVSISSGALSSEKNINAFNFDSLVNTNLGTTYTSSISGTDINFLLPTCEDISNLSPSLSISTGASVTPSGPVDFTNSDTVAVPYTVTAEDGSTQIYNVSVNFTGWVPLGGLYAFSSSTGQDLDMDVDQNNGDIACAYKDTDNGGGVSALIWQGGPWKDLGDRNFTGGLATDLSFTVRGPDQHYFIANQLSTAGDLRISESNGGAAWANVGHVSADVNLPLSDIEATTSSVYVIFRDVLGGDQVKVYEWNGSAFNDLGMPGLLTSTSSNRNNFKLTADSDTLYASYYDNSGIFKMQWFSGSTWIDEGISSFTSVDSYTYFDVADQGGSLYSATVEGGNIVVRKKSGSDWNVFGTAITDADVSVTAGNFIKLEINYAGDIYVFYRDTSSHPKLAKFNSAGAKIDAEGILPGDYINYDNVSYGNIAADNTDKLYIGYRDDSNGGKITIITY